ncbi:MAG: CarD family transcriptional regulator [Candidatus Binatia bacterium]
MTFTVGNKVVYPCRGPCLIGPVVNKVVGGRSTKFYQLALLDDSNGEVFVPVDNLRDLNIRALVDRSDIPKLLGRLKKPSALSKDLAAAKNWRQRNTDNLKLFSSGSAFDLADVVEALTGLSETKPLSVHERETLGRARKLLACEISEVMGESKSAAQAQIDSALESRNNGKHHSPQVN